MTTMDLMMKLSQLHATPLELFILYLWLFIHSVLVGQLVLKNTRQTWADKTLWGAVMVIVFYWWLITGDTNSTAMGWAIALLILPELIATVIMRPVVEWMFKIKPKENEEQ